MTVKPSSTVGRRTSPPWALLIGTLLSALALFTLCELTKQILLPDAARWVASLVTILLGSALTTLIAYGISRRFPQRYSPSAADHRAEQIQSASERRFRLLVEHSADAITLLDAKGVIMYDTPAAPGLLGYAPDELVGRNAFELIHPNDVAEVIRQFNQLQQDPTTPLTSSFRVRHRSGEWRWLEATGCNLLAEPSVQAMAVNYRDITAHKQHEREWETVKAVSAALKTAARRADMPPVILNQVADLLDMAGAALVMRDPSSDTMTVELAQGEWQRWEHGLSAPTLAATQEIFLTGQPYLNNDVRNDPAFIAQGNSFEGLSAVAGVPLMVRDHTLGVLWVGRGKQAGPAVYPEISTSEIRLLTAITNIAASAFQRAALYEQTERRAQEFAALYDQNARLLTEARQRLRQMESLHTIDVAIAASLDMQTTFTILLREVREHLGVDAADILLLDPALHTLEYAAGHGFHSPLKVGAKIRLAEDLAGRVVLERCMVGVPDLGTAGAGFDRQSVLRDEYFVAYYGVPLIAKGQIRGVLELFHRTPLETNAEWLDFLHIVAEQAAIAIDNALLFHALQQSHLELSRTYDITLEGWSRALSLRDMETEGHTQRVTEMTLQLARAMNVNEEELIHIRRGAILHDIGKIGIPDSILLKPGPLTHEEWAIMRMHPVYAYELLSPITVLQPALDIPYCHHEKWDGAGYPRGLTGEQIPLAARLFAIVDVWDALRSDRPYRPRWPEEKVREHLRASAGAHFDPQVASVFLEGMQAF